MGMLMEDASQVQKQPIPMGFYAPRDDNGDLVHTPAINVERLLKSLDVKEISLSCSQKVSAESSRLILEGALQDAIYKSALLIGGLGEVRDIFTVYVGSPKRLETQNVSNVVDGRVHIGENFPRPLDGTLYRGKIYDLVAVADWLPTVFGGLQYLKWIAGDQSEQEAKQQLADYVTCKIRVSLGLMKMETLMAIFPAIAKKTRQDRSR